MVSFLLCSWYKAIFWICAGKNVDNSEMFSLLLNRTKDFLASHPTPLSRKHKDLQCDSQDNWPQLTKGVFHPPWHHAQHRNWGERWPAAAAWELGLSIWTRKSLFFAVICSLEHVSGTEMGWNLYFRRVEYLFNCIYINTTTDIWFTNTGRGPSALLVRLHKYLGGFVAFWLKCYPGTLGH